MAIVERKVDIEEEKKRERRKKSKEGEGGDRGLTFRHLKTSQRPRYGQVYSTAARQCPLYRSLQRPCNVLGNVPS